MIENTQELTLSRYFRSSPIVGNTHEDSPTDRLYIYSSLYIIYIYCFLVGIEMCGQDEILHIVASHGITLCQHHINN